MNLKVFSVISAPKHFKPKVSSRLFNLFSSQTKEDVELVNVVTLKSGIKHIVFNLEDTLYSGTQKNGISKIIPFTQTINVFVLQNLIYIEDKGNGYINSIIKVFTEKYNFSLDELTFSNLFIANLKQQMDIRILDIYFVDTFGDKLGELESLDDYDIADLPVDVMIQSLTFQPLKLSKGYITLQREGNMTLNLNSIDELEQWLLFVDKGIS